MASSLSSPFFLLLLFLLSSALLATASRSSPRAKAEKFESFENITMATDLQVFISTADSVVVGDPKHHHQNYTQEDVFKDAYKKSSKEATIVIIVCLATVFLALLINFLCKFIRARRRASVPPVPATPAPVELTVYSG